MSTITSIINNQDGTTALLTLSGAPTGTLTVRAARTPTAAPGGLLSVAMVSTTQYNVTLAAAAADAYGQWFVRPSDNSGRLYANDTEEGNYDPVVWISLVNEDEYWEALNWLRDTLWANRWAINARLQTVYASSRLKDVVAGPGFHVPQEWPAIAVLPSGMDDEYYASDFYSKRTFRAALHGATAVVNNPILESRLNACFGQTVADLLKQQAYETTTLPSGLVLVGVQREYSLTFNEYQHQETSSWVFDWDLTFVAECGRSRN